jgi:ferredoxin
MKMQHAKAVGFDVRDSQSSGGSFDKDVTIIETGERFECRPAESLLAALARTGKRGIPVGCRGGGCGVCKIQVLSGEYVRQRMSADHVDATDLAHHRVLACRISAASDLEIRVLGKMANSVRRLVDEASK